MSLDKESRNAMVAYRQEKADVAIDDALFLTDAGRYNIAANRLYYAASALLLSQGIATKSHSGLITQMHKNYIKTGILTVEEGSLFT